MTKYIIIFKVLFCTKEKYCFARGSSWTVNNEDLEKLKQEILLKNEKIDETISIEEINHD